MEWNYPLNSPSCKWECTLDVCLCVHMLYVIAHLAFMFVYGGRLHRPFAVAATCSDSPRILLSLFSLLAFVHLLFFFIVTIRKAWLTNPLVSVLFILAELIPQVCSKIWSSHIIGPKFSDKKQGNNTMLTCLDVFCIGVCLSVVCCKVIIYDFLFQMFIVFPFRYHFIWGRWILGFVRSKQNWNVL